MIAPNPKLLCNLAESYYYDFLCKENIEPIPEPIVSHIMHCTTCQEQVDRLRAVLSEPEEYQEAVQKEVCGAVTEMLKLHFAYIGKPVTCDIVKPFLPSLLDTAIKIRIPTPITAHIDNCQKCSEDLETLQELNLSHKQLYRLSQLLAEKPNGSNTNCTEAQSAVSSVVSLVFSNTNAIILKHLCTCPDCRGLLYQRREMALRGLRKTDLMKSKFPCEKVSARDFFDYVVPYGLNLAKDQYAKFRDSLTSHLRTCPSCLVKMQQLHDIVYGIAERTESEVATTYYIDESAKAKAPVESADLYAGFPIKVEVAGREDKATAEETTATINFDAALKQKVSGKKLKPLLKTAIAAAAAVILIGSALFLSIPTTKAVTLDAIYKAVEEAKNVYIAKFDPGKTEPTQEKWVSRTLNIYMIKTAQQCVLRDIINGVKKTKYLDTKAVEKTKLPTENIISIEEKISGSLGLTPFYDISEIPPGAEWSQVTNDSMEAAEKIEVYDLKWIIKSYDGSSVFKKWRFFVNAKTNLPQRIEIYQIPPDDTEYTLTSLTTVEYLSDSELQEVIKEMSF